MISNMNVAFWDNQLCERGTTTSLYDYAHYNEKILGNKSFIFYDKNNRENKMDIIKKFQERFEVNETDNFKEVDYFLKKFNITHIYIIKSGELDTRVSTVAKNCIHCVFHCYQPHGEVYSSISPCVKGNNGKYPVVPHMINLPKHNSDLREKLGIPRGAVVFGGYGGKGSFDMMFVHEAIYAVARTNPHIYFLFANFDRFCQTLPNIIHLPMITNVENKVEFINTCDAMIWGRRGGETFGIAIGEFSSLNKPVIATRLCGGDLAHSDILQEKAIWYNSKNDLYKILVKFDPEIESKKDWNAYKEYTPEKVIEVFKKTYLM